MYNGSKYGNILLNYYLFFRLNAIKYKFIPEFVFIRKLILQESDFI